MSSALCFEERKNLLRYGALELNYAVEGVVVVSCRCEAINRLVDAAVTPCTCGERASATSVVLCGLSGTESGLQK